MSDDKKPLDQADDPELNNLLDSALEDFNIQSQATSSTKDDKEQTTSGTVFVEKKINSLTKDELWAEDFFKKAFDEFEKNLQTLMGNGVDETLEAPLERIAQTVASVADDEAIDPETVNTDFQSAIAQALKDLSASAENLQNDGDLTSMFSQMSMDDGVKNILPFVHGMMQSLLSKEVLYPSLKEVVEKYPAWLEEKKAVLSSNDLQRYKKQLELMQKVCTELENEKDDDAEDVKKRRFDVILSLMQEVQGCGEPPEGLVGESTMFQYIINNE